MSALAYASPHSEPAKVHMAIGSPASQLHGNATLMKGDLTMMTNGIKRWLRPARSKAETPTQGGAFARTGRRRRASPIAMLLGSAVICSSLAITTPWTTADAQGLRAGEGLRQARERRRRIPAAQRKAMKNAARAAAIARRLNRKTNTLDNQRGAAKSSKRAR